MKNSLCLIFTLIASNFLVAAPEDQIAERLKPIGSICSVGDACAQAASSADAAARDASSIYQSGCLACHTSGVAGAPKLGDATVWAARLSKGIDTLYDNAYNGINAMPARGLCTDCSEHEIRITVDYMLEQSK